MGASNMATYFSTPKCCKTEHSCYTVGCSSRVIAQGDRWFITIGHCGFNSTANNRHGYSTKRAATIDSLRHQFLGKPKATYTAALAKAGVL